MEDLHEPHMPKVAVRFRCRFFPVSGRLDARRGGIVAAGHARPVDAPPACASGHHQGTDAHAIRPPCDEHAIPRDEPALRKARTGAARRAAGRGNRAPPCRPVKSTGYNSAPSRPRGTEFPRRIPLMKRLLLPALLLSLAAAPAFAKGDAAKGKQLAYTCSGCHGIDQYKNA